MRLVFEFGRYVFECEYEERGIPKAAGFRWDAKRRAWFTWEPRQALRLVEHADRDAQNRLRDVKYGRGWGYDQAMTVPKHGGRRKIRHA